MCAGLGVLALGPVVGPVLSDDHRSRAQRRRAPMRRAIATVRLKTRISWGLSAANAAAALSATFVVMGSPTQTSMVESSGGRSQLAHLATAGGRRARAPFPDRTAPRTASVSPRGHRFYDRSAARRPARFARHPGARAPASSSLRAGHCRGRGGDQRRAWHPAGDGALAAPPRAPQLPSAHGGKEVYSVGP